MLFRSIFPLELVTHLAHCHPLHALMLVDMLDDPSRQRSASMRTSETPEVLDDLPFVHQNHMWPARDIGVDSHREDELVIFAVIVIEVVFPNVFDVAGVAPAVRTICVSLRFWRKWT